MFMVFSQELEDARAPVVMDPRIKEMCLHAAIYLASFLILSQVWWLCLPSSLQMETFLPMPHFAYTYPYINYFSVDGYVYVFYTDNPFIYSML